MKNLVLFALLITITLSLFGCAEAPEEVQDNMKQYNENKQIEEPSDDYCSIEELKKADIKALNEKYDNIVLPEDTDLSGIEAVSLLNVQVEENYIDKYQDKFKKLFNISTDDFEEGTSPGGKSHRFFDGSRYFGIDECGFMAYMGENHYGNSPLAVNNAEYYELGKDDNVTVDFKSKQVSLGELCKSAEDWYKTNAQTNSLDYKITDAILADVEYEDDKMKQAELFGAFSYKGICFNSYFTNHSEGANKDDYYLDMIYNASIVYDDFGVVGQFTVNNQTLNILSEEKQEKVISFENAAEKVSTKLSGFGTMEFDKVVPLYRIVMHVTNNANGYSPGQTFEARPVYAFLIEGDDWKELGNSVSPAQIYEKYCLVDMISGEFVSSIN